MYENIIAIHNVLKKKTIYLNFQPAQYFKKLAKIILKQKIFLKKKEEEEEINFGLKKAKKKTCKKNKTKKKTCYKKKHATVNIPRVLEFFNYYIAASCHININFFLAPRLLAQ